jgi:hypothetical protein
VVIGSGKGGVGKSVLSIALAAAFARMGHRTLLLDGAQNQGNLHILLGVRPARAAGRLLAGEAEPAALHGVGERELVLVPGDSGAEALYTLSAIDRARLHRRLSDSVRRIRHGRDRRRLGDRERGAGRRNPRIAPGAGRRARARFPGRRLRAAQDRQPAGARRCRSR